MTQQGTVTKIVGNTEKVNANRSTLTTKFLF